MKAIDKHPDHKISVIIFNNQARVVIGKDKPE